MAHPVPFCHVSYKATSSAHDVAVCNKQIGQCVSKEFFDTCTCTCDNLCLKCSLAAVSGEVMTEEGAKLFFLWESARTVSARIARTPLDDDLVPRRYGAGVEAFAGRRGIHYVHRLVIHKCSTHCIISPREPCVALSGTQIFPDEKGKAVGYHGAGHKRSETCSLFLLPT